MTIQESKLEQVLAEYLRAVEAGEPIDEGALLAKHPELADDLQSFFRNRQAMQRLATPIRDADMATLGLSVEAPPGPGRIRYFGDYELLDEIARGGMGVIYRARQVSLNRTVAIKMILAGQLASADDVKRFRQEAEAAANLDHPHIVPIYEVGEHEGQHYFSMKLIDGPSLAEALRTQPEIKAQRTAVELMAQVARAVHHAHQRGVLHRDLKPGNILLDASGAPHVTDFGLAKRVEGESDLTQSGAIVGTPSYMPPEQAKAEKLLTTAADVYSLGAILFELLTGQPPFKGDSAAATLLRVLSQEPPTPRSINLKIDRDLDTIVNRCLEREPARRYDSAAALADDLERWLAGEPILARPIGAWERAGKWARRHPGRATLVGVSVLSAAALLVAFGVGYYLIGEEQKKTLAEQAKTENANTNLRKQEGETRTALERLKHVSYAQSMALVRAEVDANHLERARRLLEEAPTELRHWEWDYLHKLCHGELRNLQTPEGNLRAVAFRPDGGELVIAGGEVGFGPFCGQQEVHFFDTKDYQLTRSLHGNMNLPYGAVMHAAWSPDGKQIALALWCLTDARDVVMSDLKIEQESAGRVEIWDVQERKLVHTLMQHKSFVYQVAWSRDGKLIASASSDRTANVWDAKTGERKFQLTGHKGQIKAVAFNRAGTLIATGSEGPLTDFGSSTPNDMGELKLWDAATGEEKQSLDGHDQAIFTVAFSPDDATLLSAGRDTTIKLWNVADAKLLRTLFGHLGAVTDVDYSPDGTKIASASADRTVRLWSAADGKPLSVLRGHTIDVESIAFHPDGRYLVSCAEVHRSNTPEVKLWDLAALPEVVRCGTVAQEVRKSALSHDGKLLASAVTKQGGQYHEVRVWDATTGEQLATLKGDDSYPDELRFTPEGRLMALYGSATVDVRTFDPRGQTPHQALRRRSFKQYDPPEGFSLRGIDVAVTADTTRIATYDVAEESILVTDLTNGKEVWRVKHPSLHSLDLLWSGDGTTLVAVNEDQIPVDPSKPDDTAWRTTRVRAWDFAAKKELFSHTPTGFYGWRMKVSHDGRYFVILHEDKPGVKLWDVPAGKEVELKELDKLTSLHAHFSPQGDRLVTVHQAGERVSMRVWSVPDGKLVATLDDFSGDHRGPYYGGDVEFSSDGRRIFTCGDGTVKVWDAAQGTLLLTLLSADTPLTMSADGATIAATGPQGLVQVWTKNDPRRAK